MITLRLELFAPNNPPLQLISSDHFSDCDLPNKPNFKDLKKKMKEDELAEVETCANSEIDPNECKLLTKLINILGFDVDMIMEEEANFETNDGTVSEISYSIYEEAKEETKFQINNEQSISLEESLYNYIRTNDSKEMIMIPRPY